MRLGLSLKEGTFFIGTKELWYPIYHPQKSHLFATKAMFHRPVYFDLCMSRWDPSVHLYRAHDRREIVVIGKRGIGKTCILWQLFRQKEKCRQSMIDSRTEMLNFFRVGRHSLTYSFVDTPGFDHDNMGEWNELVMNYLATSRSTEVMEMLHYYQIPTTVAVSKKDLLPVKQHQEHLATVRSRLPAYSNLSPYAFTLSSFYEDDQTRALQFRMAKKLNWGKVSDYHFDSDDYYEMNTVEQRYSSIGKRTEFQFNEDPIASEYPCRLVDTTSIRVDSRKFTGTLSRPYGIDLPSTNIKRASHIISPEVFQLPYNELMAQKISNILLDSE